MSEQAHEPAGDLQDPAEPKRVDEAVVTESQPNETSDQSSESHEKHVVEEHHEVVEKSDGE